MYHLVIGININNNNNFVIMMSKQLQCAKHGIT